MVRRPRDTGRSLTAALVLLALVSAPTPAGAQATFDTEVPAGKWKAVRVRNLPEGAMLSIAVRLEGTVDVAVVNAADWARDPRATRPVFRGRAERRLQVTVTVPAAGHYLVVLDNRAGDTPRAVEVTIHARRVRPTPPRPTPRREDPQT